MKVPALAFVAAACEPAAAPQPPASNPAITEPRFEARIREVADRYEQWGRVDDQLRQAPIPCTFGPVPDTRPPRASAAGEGLHAHKLYYLYSNDSARYRSDATTFEPGFAIVKEAFAVNTKPWTEGMWLDGKPAHVGERLGLFVMVKLVVRVETDAGWIYGTVTPAGEVVAAGRIASCMACHEDATRERLFGI